MKKCPFCAEEIQDVAVVCRFCQRDLPAPAVPPPPEPSGPTRAPAAVTARRRAGCLVALLLFGLVAAIPILGTRAPDGAVLKIRAGRGPLGFSFTNQESSPLRQCDATVRDADGKEWFATVPKRLEVSETATVPWSAFTNNGQPLPGFVGRDRGIVVSCVVEGSQERRSAGIWK